MEHLTTDALARLVDEVPSPEESGHLEACEVCAAELDALREQTDQLGALPAMRPPQGDWEALEARLLAEGLIHSDSVIPFGRSRRRWGTAIQAAAALVLFVGGAALGTQFRGGEPGAIEGGPLAGPASLVDTPTSDVALATLEDAAEDVRQKEQDYIEAMIRYRQLLEASGRGGTQGQDPASRYAALEAVMAASQAAVREAPADPFLNGILASVSAERQAFVRSLSETGRDNWY
jgi:hypothetical protein